MPPPLRIAQTTSEVKKLHKQNGPRLAERQMKQLERGHELDLRAARLREAEERKKAAKKKREEKEEKERAARRQMGVGLATQLIGYSHTQAQLKNGMEAFLGLKRRKEEEQRRRQAELTKTLEAIAQEVEKEPWDEDDEDDDEGIDIDDAALDLPQHNTANATSPEQYADDDLDDDTLLEAHDLLMSDPPEESTVVAPVSEAPPQPAITTAPPEPQPARDDADFVRLHGPINKTVESILDKLPHPLVELMSQDVSMRLPEWDPAPGLLHKLNPIGLPPHRLRIKIGSVVTLLRDLNTSSQLSKSQHLRVLRADNDRLECLVLDGQLEGAKALLTRVPFPAKYRNDTLYPFQRTQFPIRIATDYIPKSQPRETPSSGFKLPTVPAHVRSSSSSKQPSPVVPEKTQPNGNEAFKLPGLPASKKIVLEPTVNAPKALAAPFLNDGWDDFLDSGTQIARELSAETTSPRTRLQIPIAPSRASISHTLPPLSTQDLDFSIDDLDDSPISADHKPADVPIASRSTNSIPVPSVNTSKAALPAVAPIKSGSIAANKLSRQTPAGRRAPLPPKTVRKQQQSARPCLNIDLTALTPSQRPPSVSDRPGWKRKTPPLPLRGRSTLAKRPCAAQSRPVAASSTRVKQPSAAPFDDFGISTQDAASFFADDEELFTGSPPIAV